MKGIRNPRADEKVIPCPAFPLVHPLEDRGVVPLCALCLRGATANSGVASCPADGHPRALYASVG